MRITILSILVALAGCGPVLNQESRSASVVGSAGNLQVSGVVEKVLWGQDLFFGDAGCILGVRDESRSRHYLFTSDPDDCRRRGDGLNGRRIGVSRARESRSGSFVSWLTTHGRASGLPVEEGARFFEFTGRFVVLDAYASCIGVAERAAVASELQALRARRAPDPKAELVPGKSALSVTSDERPAVLVTVRSYENFGRGERPWVLSKRVALRLGSGSCQVDEVEDLGGRT